MISNCYIDFLRKHSLLQGIPEDELRVAAASIEVVSFEDGQTLLLEDTSSKDCFFIWQGKVQVTSRNLVDKELLLAELGPGELVGEIGLIRNERRSARVTAIGEVKALRLDRSSFEYLASRSPLFYESMLVNVRIRMIHSMLRKATIWAAIPDAEIRGLAEITTIRKVVVGEEIVTPGMRVDQFFMINKGKIELRGKKQHRTVLREGDFFGETELLTDTVCSYKYIAVEECELLVMGKDEFLCILEYYAPVRQQLLNILRIRAPHLMEKVTLIVNEELEKEQELVKEEKADLPQANDKWVDQLLWLGGCFLLFSLLTMFLHNPWWRIAALVIGGIVGPVTFVAFVRSQQLLGFRQTRLAMIFILTAIVAIPIAWYLERMWLFGENNLTLQYSQFYMPLSIALIEESAKLLIYVMIIRTRQNHFLMDAIVFGAAAGMGFAAVESVFYGWAHLDEASSLGMLTVLWMRALLSPFGHGTWTAIAAAGIWYASSKNSTLSSLNTKAWMRWRRTFGLLLAPIVLHTLWNYRFESGLLKAITLVAVGAIGIYMLYSLIRRGRREEFHALSTLNPIMHEAIQHDEPMEDIKLELRCLACGTMSPQSTRYCARCGQALRSK